MATKSKKQEDIQTLDAVDEAATEATEESKVENGGDTGESENGNTEAATSVDGNTITLDDDGDIKPLAADDYVENFEVGGKTYAVRDVEAQDSITQLNSDIGNMSDMFKSVTWQSENITIPGNSYSQFALSDVSIPDGYTPIAFRRFYSGYTMCFFVYVNALSGTLGLYNTSSATITISPYMEVICVKTEYIG